MKPATDKEGGFAIVYVMAAIAVITTLGLAVLQQLSSQEILARSSEKKVDKNELVFHIDKTVNWQKTWEEICKHAGYELTFKGNGPRFEDIRNATAADMEIPLPKESGDTRIPKREYDRGEGEDEDKSYKAYWVVHGKCGEDEEVIVNFARIINGQFTRNPIDHKPIPWQVLAHWYVVSQPRP